MGQVRYRWLLTNILLYTIFTTRITNNVPLQALDVLLFHNIPLMSPLQALDVLLGELAASLDEDMADLDEYELGYT